MKCPVCRREMDRGTIFLVYPNIDMFYPVAAVALDLYREIEKEVAHVCGECMLDYVALREVFRYGKI